MGSEFLEVLLSLCTTLSVALEIASLRIKASIDLSTTSSQLREVVETVTKGGNWGLNNEIQVQQKLSHREQEVMTLLAKGLRDRDIADQLYISDSTVKFHIHNTLIKLEAKTRIQALYKLMSTDGLEF